MLAQNEIKMKRNFVTPVFNRRKDLEKRGFSKVELLICLTRKDKKYISVKECNEKEWATFQHSAELKAQRLHSTMTLSIECMTIMRR